MYSIIKRAYYPDAVEPRSEVAASGLTRAEGKEFLHRIAAYAANFGYDYGVSDAGISVNEERVLIVYTLTTDKDAGRT